jgi:uncharacterized protein (DUF302 family)
MTPAPVNDIVSIASNHSVDATVEKLRAILEAKAAKLFVLVDHSGEAEKAGLSMRNTKLLIFGNPQAGTPLMLASPTIALDLPMKILVREDEHTKVSITYNSVDHLIVRHNLRKELAANIAVIDALAANAAT